MQQPDPDPSHILPRHLYYQVIHALRVALPPPASDSREDLHRRDGAAIAQVASLLPANGEEALLAAQYVAASAQALDCLRLVRAYPADVQIGLKCTAQAASMMRQARGARSLLASVQAARQKREANDPARDAAAWTEHCVAGLMLHAVRDAWVPTAEPGEPTPPNGREPGAGAPVDPTPASHPATGCSGTGPAPDRQVSGAGDNPGPFPDPMTGCPGTGPAPSDSNTARAGTAADPGPVSGPRAGRAIRHLTGSAPEYPSRHASSQHPGQPPGQACTKIPGAASRRPAIIQECFAPLGREAALRPGVPPPRLQVTDGAAVRPRDAPAAAAA